MEDIDVYMRGRRSVIRVQLAPSPTHPMRRKRTAAVPVSRGEPLSEVVAKN